MDLHYLKEHPGQLPVFIKHQRIRETPVPAGRSAAPSGSPSTTAARSSASPSRTRRRGSSPPRRPGCGGCGSPARCRSRRSSSSCRSCSRSSGSSTARPTPDGAERLGRRLAGAAPGRVRRRSGRPGPGSSARRRCPTTPRTGPGPTWFAERRLLPFLRISVDNGALTGADIAGVERVIAGIEGFGGAEPPCRIHGDLWPGNVLWAAPTTGLAGRPGRARRAPRDRPGASSACWRRHRRTWTGSWPPTGEAWPLADGWRDRVPLHQLHLLLVHTALFGVAYRGVGPLHAAAL